MRTTLTLAISILTATLCQAQLQKGDTVLYLSFAAGHDQKSEFIEDVAPGREHYRITSIPYVYDGLPLRFISIQNTRSGQLRAKRLKHKFVANVKQLSDFIQANYGACNNGFCGATYFDTLKHIYIVERTPCKGFVTVTKVKLNIRK